MIPALAITPAVSALASNASSTSATQVQAPVSAASISENADSRFLFLYCFFDSNLILDDISMEDPTPWAPLNLLEDLFVAVHLSSPTTHFMMKS